MADAALDYLLSLAQEKPHRWHHPHALSPRASKALLSAARVWALYGWAHYLPPDDIQAILPRG